MKHIKTFEENNNDTHKYLVDTIVNLVDSSMDSIFKCSVAKSGNDTYYIICDGLVFLCITTTSSIELYKTGFTRLSSDMTNFLSECFSKISRMKSTQSDNTRYFLDSSNVYNVKKLIDSLTIDNYKKYLIDIETKKYNV